MSPFEKGGKPKLVYRSVGLVCGSKANLDSGCITAAFRSEPERQEGGGSSWWAQQQAGHWSSKSVWKGRWPRVRKYPVSWTVPRSGHLVRGLERAGLDDQRQGALG